MKGRSKWYDEIAGRISSHKDTLSPKDQKRYKLDLFLRVAGRVDGFSPECGECQIFQNEITRLTVDLGNLSLMSKEWRKGYFRSLNNIIKHLRAQHKLVTDGQYMGIGIAIGVGPGTAIGAGVGNPGVGIAIGTAIGVAIGSYLNSKAKKEGKVI